MLLTGLPGTGKSCTIRGILNETGRHGVLVSWSKLKTCSDFCSIFRLTEINNKKYLLKDLCFIFEDFDANNNGILRDRGRGGVCCSDVESVSVVDLEESKKNGQGQGQGRGGEVDLDLQKLLLGGIVKGVRGEDDLTLECVLNVLDGIVELHGAMIIFTTNHLEQIDPAFFRSGRIDYRKEFKLASVGIIKEMVAQIRKIDVGRGEYAAYFEKMGDDLISPADVQSVCFKYTNNDADIILGELVELCGSALREGVALPLKKKEL
jgi:SpoVK/Ycf46/Vps4 family AAA+-type ATPase